MKQILKNPHETVESFVKFDSLIEGPSVPNSYETENVGEKILEIRYAWK